MDITNTRKWEYEKYLVLAEEHGYEIEEVIVGGLDEESIKLYTERDVHGVPLETIRKMAERFEK